MYMTVKIITQKDNAVLKRKEILAEFSHPGKPTPLRKDLLTELEQPLKVEKDHIVIDKILTKKGSASSQAKIFVFPKKEDIPAHMKAKQDRRLGLAKKEAKPEEAKPAESSEKK